MARKNPFTDQELLDYSEEHLLYELHMFRWVGERMEGKTGFDLSAYLESFAIHLRNLIDFFYLEPTRDDDVAALDFFDDPRSWAPGAFSATLDAARERANKEVNHITSKRKVAADATKPWNVRDLFNEIDAVAKKFAAEASGKRLHGKVRDWLKSAGEARNAILVNASTQSSNVASYTISTSGGVGSGAKDTNTTTKPNRSSG